ncbi:hypothetical protein DAPPUDRAFT_116418 [Daphnia pulex]|uniref:Uncharacterized protein n=1 Tax=Daphnia pulex TaxID=6669 RepID=E9HPC5_DAPPU|nr:hypothetical protein DAPPUDRAFT_116418 [Daphnia pulex]|eukprot:EFX66420.1 hypothetical protein DAPPUDRAFT_116418 [Daphnia pulex]
MPRPNRVYKRVVYAESSSCSTIANPQVPSVVPPIVIRPPPASPSERGQSVGSMPALVPIWPPTLVAASSSDDGFPPPLVSSEGSSSPFEPYDFETQHSLKANYLATLLTSYTTQERIAGYYTFRRQMDAHLSTLSQDDQYQLLPPHRDN